MEHPSVIGSFVPIQRSKIFEEVIEAIESYVAAENLKKGDKLPSESELAESLGVGRRSVREAYKTLQARGMVDIIHGRGVFLAERQMDVFTQSLAKSLSNHIKDDESLLLDVVTVRKLIEGAIAGNLAEKRPAKSIALLEDIVAQQKTAVTDNDTEEYNRLDVLFHETIVDASDNTILVILYKHFYDLLLKSFHETGYLPGVMKESFPEHNEILSNIKKGRKKKVEELLSAHIDKSMKNLKMVIEKKTSRRGNSTASQA